MLRLLIGAAAVSFAALSLPAPALAQQPAAWHEMTAKELAANCHSPDAAKKAECVGYVSAIYDLQFTSNPPGLCLPPTLTPDTLSEVVVAYIDTHDDGPAPAAVGQSIVRFFPCTASSANSSPPAVHR
jgi:Rap1a immunity proteins